MKHSVPQSTSVQPQAVSPVRLAIVPARAGVRAWLSHSSPVELGVAQATLAVALALAVYFFEARGVAKFFLLGAASLVLVISGLLLVVWSDPDAGAHRPT